MKTRKPLISVVMSVRDNNFNYLETAINSILYQSYKLFEFIIVVDGSKQSVINIINLYKSQDDRIKIILTKQIGLTAALNLAIKSSQGKYIARQDYDDISLSNRLEEQFFFLENNTEYIFCSSNFFKINKVGSRLFSRKINISHNKIKKILEYKNIFAHSSVFFSKKFFDKVGGYNENFIFSQDFELWTRLIKFGKFKLLQEKLIELRIHDKSLSYLNNKKQRIYSFFIGLKYIFPTLEELNKSINSHNFLTDLENLCQHNKDLYNLFKARKYIYLYDEVNFFAFLNFSLHSIISIIIILLHRPNYIFLRILGK